MTEKKISTAQLVPGMYIINSGATWKDNPYLYSREGVATEALIEKILHDGYTEVVIDQDRSEAEEASASAEEADDLEGFVLPAHALSAEWTSAKGVYMEALDLSRGMMDHIRRGDKVDLHKGKVLVESLLQSITRNPDAMLALAKLRDADEYTYSHSINVSVLGLAFAKHLNFSRQLQFEVGLSGFFHDLGKALVPEEVLNAPRQLTEAEFAILRKHPRLGYEYVKKTPGFTNEVLMGIYDHHERFDGKGYPRSLPGDQISHAGRVLAVVDVYDALSSRRPYKQAMLPYKVLGTMYQMRSEDFFPGLMENFIRMLGVYPTGSVVEVSGGDIGVVTASNPHQPTKPKVLLLLDKDRKRLADIQEIDTSLRGAPMVTRAMDDGEIRINPAKLLNAR
ncbi:MAG: HD-GYP domain-containing protein [Desulfovibrionaceae bacterium]|nr:HD-GYP domain-containing protein [Desulfovibrionaceae bacterium]